MGLTIHYSGSIRQYELIDALMEETADICNSLDWKYQMIDDDQLKGIVVMAEGSEPLFLTFTSNNKLCSITSVMFNNPDDPFYYTAFTKTQFAGVDTHIALVKLLRYLSNKYFAEINVNDEGYYWETNDENIVREQFARYNSLLNTVCDALSGMSVVPGETIESLADRIENVLRKKLEDKKGKG